MPKCNRHIDCVACVLEREKCEQCCCPDINQFFEKIVEQNRRVKELEERFNRDHKRYMDGLDQRTKLQAQIKAAVKELKLMRKEHPVWFAKSRASAAYEILNPKPTGKEGE